MKTELYFKNRNYIKAMYDVLNRQKIPYQIKKHEIGTTFMLELNGKEMFFLGMDIKIEANYLERIREIKQGNI